MSFLLEAARVREVRLQTDHLPTPRDSPFTEDKANIPTSIPLFLNENNFYQERIISLNKENGDLSTEISLMPEWGHTLIGADLEIVAPSLMLESHLPPSKKNFRHIGEEVSDVSDLYVPEDETIMNTGSHSIQVAWSKYLPQDLLQAVWFQLSEGSQQILGSVYVPRAYEMTQRRIGKPSDPTFTGVLTPSQELETQYRRSQNPFAYLLPLRMPQFEANVPLLTGWTKNLNLCFSWATISTLLRTRSNSSSTLPKVFCGENGELLKLGHLKISLRLRYADYSTSILEKVHHWMDVHREITIRQPVRSLFYFDHFMKGKNGDVCLDLNNLYSTVETKTLYVAIQLKGAESFDYADTSGNDPLEALELQKEMIDGKTMSRSKKNTEETRMFRVYVPARTSFRARSEPIVGKSTTHFTHNAFIYTLQFGSMEKESGFLVGNWNIYRLSLWVHPETIKSSFVAWIVQEGWENYTINWNVSGKMEKKQA